MIAKLLKDEVQQYIKDHQHDDPFLLSLRSKQAGEFPLKEAIEQIHSYQKAKNKIPSWANTKGIIWPTPLSVEQASSETTARYKTELLTRENTQTGELFMADLTGGMGVDTCFFASNFKEVCYAEQNKELAVLARHNFKVLGKTNIVVHPLPAEEFLAKNKIKFDTIYLDPSRRDKSRKVFMIEDCTPNLFELLPMCLATANRVLVKLSPMVDLLKLIQDIGPNKIWVISVKNEVKEVLCLIENKKKETVISAIDLTFENGENSVFEFEKKEETLVESEFALPLNFIYKPSSAALKTGAFKLIGQRFGLKKLHINTHLYTSDKLIKEFPGRIFQLRKILKQDKKEIAREIPGKQVNVLTANYPLTPDQLKKKLFLHDGGDQYIIGTTLTDGKKALLCCDRIS